MNDGQQVVLRLLADPRRQLYLQNGGGYALTHSAAERHLYPELSAEEVAEIRAAGLIEPAWEGAEPFFYRLVRGPTQPTKDGGNDG